MYRKVNPANCFQWFQWVDALLVHTKKAKISPKNIIWRSCMIFVMKGTTTNDRSWRTPILFSLFQLSWQSNTITLIFHVPYSPDLTPWDFWLFLKLKKLLKWIQFQLQDIARHVMAQINFIPKQAFQKCFSTIAALLVEKYMQSQGDYFGGDKNFRFQDEFISQPKVRCFWMDLAYIYFVKYKCNIWKDKVLLLYQESM